MQISNPLQINDWEIKKFLEVVLAVQLVMWGAMGLDAIGLQIPILRQLIGFLYLTFVPGILILRILKLHKLGNIETILYTVGLSIATLMFTGFFMNMIYPLFGISGPISLIPLIVTISVVVLMLCVLCYVRDKDFADPSFIDTKEILSPPVLFLCLIPFMAVFGTYLVNFHHHNILLMLMIVVIVIVALLIGFDKFIPQKLYPLAIWVIAISLIYHNTLISIYLNIFDVVSEYYISNLIINNSFWDWTIFGNYNAVLSNVMLAPIFHHICGLNLAWVFKIIYPLLFSLVPLGLYMIFQKRTDNKIAFLSSFFFISVYPFYTIISSTTKQSTAEIFFVLLLMLILNRNIDKIKGSFLSIIFAISLIVSHYGTSYLFMFSLIFVFFFLFLTENLMIKDSKKNFYLIKRKKRINSNVKNKALDIDFVLLFVTFTMAWYMYMSGSSAFNAIVHMGDHIANTIFTEFLSPESSRGMHTLVSKSSSLLHIIYRVSYFTTQFFICVGILKLLLKRREMKFEKEYIVFSLYWFMIILLSIAISGFAAMNPYRLFHLSLFLCAPLCMIGGIAVFKVITGVFKISWTNKSIKRSVNILYIFFVIFFLFNTSFIFEIAKDHPSSISLSQESVNRYGNIQDRGSFYSVYTPEQNVFSARWLSTEMKKDEKIYATLGHGEGGAALYVYGMIPFQKMYRLTNTTKKIEEGAYIYLHYVNVVEGIGLDMNPELGCPTFFNMTGVYPLLEDKNKIYTNGGSEILWS